MDNPGNVWCRDLILTFLEEREEQTSMGAAAATSDNTAAAATATATATAASNSSSTAEMKNDGATSSPKLDKHNDIVDWLLYQIEHQLNG